MKEYYITAVNGNIDWAGIPQLEADQIQWKPDCGVRCFAQFCYDEDNLYVHLKAVEKDIRAEHTEPLSSVYEDSCMEFFFMPGNRYFNFEINPNGCLYVGFGHNASDNTALYRSDFSELFDIRSDRTEDGWEVYYRIPLSFIQIFYPAYKFTGTLKANVYKCGDKTVCRHYLAWSPILTEKPNFHRTQDFGTMIFE